jgi:hypothetical protein
VSDPVQVTHAAAAVPHAELLVPAAQPPSDSQHPLEQVLALQPPSLEAVWHVPWLLQVWFTRQRVHATPLVPQSLFELAPVPGRWHTPVPSQQPLQLAELQPASLFPPWQTPSALHTAPPLQAWQVAPPAPHALSAVGPTPGF